MAAIGPRQQRLADDYAAALERLGNRSVKATTEALEASLADMLANLRRFYAGFTDPTALPYVNAQGDVTQPFSYSIGEATARYDTLVQQARQFMPEDRLQALQAVYERDLAAAASLGGELSAKLIRLVDRAADVFAGSSPEAVRAAAEITSAYIRGETMAFRNTLVQIVTRGAGKGVGWKSIEREIREALRGARDPDGITQRMGLEQRAELIARSELSNAYVRAQQDTARAAGYDLVRWVATQDERTCMFCGSRHGRIFRADEVVAPAHPRCVLPDTQVSPGPIAAAFLSMYRGPVVAIGLQSGDRLTVTANHPVLTSTGWVKAGDLCQGDQLVGQQIDRLDGADNPDLYQVPATAEEVFTAFAGSGAVSAVSVPAATVDLHGDWVFVEGNIQVVRASGLLQGYRATAVAEGDGEGGSRGADVRFAPLFGLGHQDALSLGLNAASRGAVRRMSEALAVLGGGVGHAEQHCIAARAWADPLLAQSPDNAVPINAEALSQGFDAGALHELLGDGGGIDRLATADGGEDVQIPQDGVDPVPANPELLGEFLNLHAGSVLLHEVVSVEISEYAGHVYTFETFSGAYLAGSTTPILTGNCRCALVPAPEGSDTAGDADSEYWDQSRKDIAEEIAKAKQWELNKVNADLAKYLKKPTPSERRQMPGIEVAIQPVA